MKITKPELFRIALKIILVGTGIVLSPHKYFQFDRTLKNVVVNSESAFGGIFGKPPFGALLKRSKGMTWKDWIPLGGDPLGCGRPHVGFLHGAPTCLLVSLLGPCEGLHSCGFWVFVLNYPTPWDFL